MKKKIMKKIAKECYLCGERDYSLLDVHRIQWGKSYSRNNTVVICIKCHRRIHCYPPQIVVFSWLMSTKGRVLHYCENGVEFFK